MSKLRSPGNESISCGRPYIKQSQAWITTPLIGMRINRGIKITGIVLGLFVGLVMLLALFGYLLPSETRLVDTSATLAVTNSELFPYFNSRAGQKQVWTHVAEHAGAEPMNIVDLGGPDAGVGTKIGFYPPTANLGWVQSAVSSFVRGEGIITASDPLRSVVYEIDFRIVKSRRTINFDVLDTTSTRVSWTEDLSTLNPLMRYLLLFADTSANAGFNNVLASAEEIALTDRASN